jgi:uncharacterized protein
MWTLPGYGDVLERYHPDLRKQMAEAGVAEGFEDVVATINPIAEDQPGTPAPWSVTFAVEDADVRMTVIGDPQGATFIASTFVPENKDLAR